MALTIASPNPLPPVSRLTRFIPTIKSVKYRGQLFRLQPLTSICYQEADALIIGGSPQGNFSTRRGMAQAIEQQVE